MKTQQCSDPEPHDEHSWSIYNPVALGQYHNRYCNGIKAPHLDTPSEALTKINKRLHKLIGRPFKLATVTTPEFAMSVVEHRVKNLKKQLRTRDRKITRLTKERQDLATALGVHLGAPTKMDPEDVAAAYERAEIMVLGDTEHRRRTGRSILR